MLNKFSIFTSCLKIESTVCTVITPTENDTIATVDEPQNSLHRTSNEDSGIIHTNTTIEL